jgi:hypothetical protein
MEHRSSQSFRTFFPAALTMFILGWGGLALLFYSTEPTVWPRWGFYILWTLALTGTALPVTWFLNLRFPSNPPAGEYVVMRQAIWFGVYGSTLAWLQLGHILTLWYILGLALGLIAIEYLIRMRERSRWQPTPPTEIQPDDSQPTFPDA